MAKTGNNALLLVELTAARLAILCYHGDGLILRLDDGRLVVAIVTAVVQFLLTIIHHEAKVVQLGLQLGVVWGFQWLTICITSWAKLKASTLDLIDALPTQTGKSFLHCSGKSIEPVVFPQGKLNPLHSGRFNLYSEACNN